MPKSDEVERLMHQALMAHISDEELAEYYDKIVNEGTRARIEAHLERCLICSRKWEMMKGVLDAYYREPSLVHLILQYLTQVLRHVVTKWARERGLQFAFAAGAREAPIKAEGEVLNGALWWDISEDGTGNLSVKLGSFILELEGTVLEVGIGKLSKRAVLKRVPGAEDQVGAEVVFTPEEREGIAPDAERWIEVVEIPQSLKGE